MRATILAVVLALLAARAPAAPAPPSELYGELYKAVELNRVFPDSKTFADAIPRSPPAQIVIDFAAHPPADGDIDGLRRFVLDHFDLPPEPPPPPTQSRTDLTRHIDELWPRLTRSTPEVPDGASALPLPQPYVVPGGRFRELYYWDSYFTLLGLKASGRDDLVEDMIEDFGSLIDRYGHIPNGTRTYYLSRSQPPAFVLMLGLSADHSRRTLERRNAWLIAEHRFWMAGAATLRPGEARERVLRLADGALLNRYWDDRPLPRDEAYREDVLLAKATRDRDPADLWRNVRAAAESGWDFSSRWFADGKTLGSIRTTRLAPVDLNSLMFMMERTIADDCQRLAEPACAHDFAGEAEARARAIRTHLWNGRFFADYDIDGARPSHQLTAAAAWPLFARIAAPTQGAADARALARLVGPGGLATTLVRSGQQWDAPNGWAPLQWVASVGLRNYGERSLATRIQAGWLSRVNREYLASGRLLEKYDVLEDKPGGGGEYPTQDGFGWTNGVSLAFIRADPARGQLAPSP
jgi:alpha,alpha-trehalase